MEEEQISYQSISYQSEAQARVVERVLQSRKYRTVLPSYVAQIAQQELSKGRSTKEAVKAVKNQLHQSAAAYQVGKMDYDGWLAHLAEARSDAVTHQDERIWRDALLRVMAGHASTQERLSTLPRFYDELLIHLQKDGELELGRILDIACGLNPLTIPWMQAEGGEPMFDEYLAWDIFADQVDFLNAFFDLTQIPGRAEQMDALTAEPPPADLVMLLKTIPCLEQVQKNAGQQLLDRLQARYILVSYPVVSLGGRRKGMAETYEEQFVELMAGRPWRWERLPISDELVFLIKTD